MYFYLTVVSHPCNACVLRHVMYVFMSHDVTSGDFQTVWECDLEFCNCVCGFFGGVSTNLRIELLRGQSTLSHLVAAVLLTTTTP